MTLRKLFLMLFLQLVSLSCLRAGEKAYLHLDNSAYFLGDTLRLSAYVMDADTKRLTDKSKVLYVEILSSEGNVVDKRTYPLLHGKCAGDIWLSPLFLSGLFEIRAYTRYMQNDGDANYYSRVIPVYEPVEKGQYHKLAMRRRYTRNNYKPYSGIAEKKKFLDRNKNYQQTVSNHENMVPLYVSSICEESSLVPFGIVTIKLKGKPNTNISLSVVDNDNYMSSFQENISSFVNGNSIVGEVQQNGLSYCPEKGISVYGSAYEEKFKMGKGKQHIPISYDSLSCCLFKSDSKETQKFQTDSSGKFDLCLGTVYGDAAVLLKCNNNSAKPQFLSVAYPSLPRTRKYSDQELGWQKKVCMNDSAILVSQFGDFEGRKNDFKTSIMHIDILQEYDRFMEANIWYPSHPSFKFKGGGGLFFLADILDLHFDKLWYCIRTITLPDKYPGDNTIPKSDALYDFDFDLFKYTDLIIRSDDAICNEYSFSKHLAADGIDLPAVFAQARFVGRNNCDGAWSKDSNKPSQICCAVPDMKREWDKYLSYNSIQGYRYFKISGYSTALPYRQPNYSKSHPEHDFRRTLYWNPDLQLDENGEATIQFYNNGTCKKLHISGEGVSDDGQAIVVK